MALITVMIIFGGRFVYKSLSEINNAVNNKKEGERTIRECTIDNSRGINEISNNVIDIKDKLVHGEKHFALLDQAIENINKVLIIIAKKTDHNSSCTHFEEGVLNDQTEKVVELVLRMEKENG